MKSSFESRTHNLTVAKEYSKEKVMGLGSSKLEGKDYVALVVCAVMGIFLASFLPDGPWTVYVPMLVSYHLFLGWMVATAEHEATVTMPLWETIVTHVCCVIVVVCFGKASQYLHYIPFFASLRSVLRCSVAAMAIFERDWLFKGPSVKEVVVAPTSTTVMAATVDDFRDWQSYIAQQKPPFPGPGTTLKAEYERWLLARGKSQA
jgi:hypothetical protein